MMIPSTKRAAEVLISALAVGDVRIQTSFRTTLARTVAEAGSLRREELEALQAIAEGFETAAEPDKRAALEPTLRHLLARVL